MSPKQVHLTEINEFLSGCFLDYASSFEIELKDITNEGFVTIKTDRSNGKFAGDSVDFDLSGCECLGLFDNSPDEFHNKAVYTSSPYELIEFLLASHGTIKLLVDMQDGSWITQLIEFSE